MDLDRDYLFVDLHDDMGTIAYGKLFINIFKKYPSAFELEIGKDIEYEDGIRIMKQFIDDPVRDADFHSVKESSHGEIDRFILVHIDREKEVMFVLEEDLTGILYIDYDQMLIFKEKILPMVNEIKAKSMKQKMHKFHMISFKNNEPELSDFDVIEQSVSIEDNYNDDFIHIDQGITKFLNTPNESGLVLLHGLQGTGKTSYIRHLIYTQDLKFIYLPLEFLANITSPSFLPFMSKHRNAVLILEDCEDLMKSREHNNATNQGLINLLNLADGLLSDALGLKVIATFNMDFQNIDKALLRKGRLVVRYEFKLLEKNKAVRLAEKIGADIEVKEDLSLVEIYRNVDHDYSDLDLRRKVGFK